MAKEYLDKDGLLYLWGKLKNAFASKDVVSKTANGLAPQLPNETTTTKFLRQDGTWAVPPAGSSSVGTIDYDETSISLSANGYAWGSITVPSGRTLIAPAGFWIRGTNNTQVMVYAFYQENANTIQIAVRTWASSAHTVTARIFYLYT